jgi:hypothetical protein
LFTPGASDSARSTSAGHAEPANFDHAVGASREHGPRSARAHLITGAIELFAPGEYDAWCHPDCEILTERRPPGM